VIAAGFWRVGPKTSIDLSTARLLGILNCTPDSFSDGGRWSDTEHAVDGALAMLEDGACSIDIGGESTRPGADRICAATQIERVVPVIEGIRRATTAPITIDTTLSSVAAAALDAGADAINDVAAGTEDEAMFALAADRQCGLVLMHRLHRPDNDRYSTAYAKPPVYEDVVTDVLAWLEQRASAAEAAGVNPASICIDPGLGFGKTVAQNWALIAASDRFAATGRPVLAAASRKSFIAAMVGGGASEGLDEASAVVTAMQYTLGLRFFRVHSPAVHDAALSVLGAFTDPLASPSAC
jgi:dihydropteroate synthase